MDLSTYFRINQAQVGQFERTLIIAEPGSFVSYLEGCSSPARPSHQLHAAVVEIIAHDNATVHYSTVQNWYAGDEISKGGIYNFVTKRAECRGSASFVRWTQVETGSALTWKYPSVILKGDDSAGEFYSIALTHHNQQADTGTKMIHVGKNTRSLILSKGISAGNSQNTYRGMVRIGPQAFGARNQSSCDSMLIGLNSKANTYPSLHQFNASSRIEHEASLSKLQKDQIDYLSSRGLEEEASISLIVHGFCKGIIEQLPLEFAVEAQQLLGLQLEGAIG